MKKFIKLGASIVALALIVVGVGGNLQVVSAAEGAMSPAFTDTKGHWAKSYIDRIAEKGIVQGKSRNRYAPDDNLSRAELLKIALNAFGQEVDAKVTEDVLSDVKGDDWFAPYVRAAFKHKIIYGFNEGFGPNTPATRGMAVTILVKAAGFGDVDAHFSENYSGKAGLKTASFKDVPVEAYYAPFIAYLYDKQIIDGYEDGTFGPGNFITRAEIAKIVVNLLDEVTPVEVSEPMPAVLEPEVLELDEPTVEIDEEILEPSEHEAIKRCGEFTRGEYPEGNDQSGYYVCYNELYTLDEEIYECDLVRYKYSPEEEAYDLDFYTLEGVFYGVGTKLGLNVSACYPTTEEYFNSIKD